MSEPAPERPQPDDARERVDARRVRVRRAPRFARFLLFGAVLGILAALIGTSVTPIDADVGFGPTFAVFALYAVVAGMLLGAIVALVFDRALGRRARTVSAERARPEQEPAGAAPSSAPSPPAASGATATSGKAVPRDRTDDADSGPE